MLLADIEARKIDVVVVYKIDRLTRSLADFAKLVEAFDARSISFVAVTQQFNTTTSMGRLNASSLVAISCRSRLRLAPMRMLLVRKSELRALPRQEVFQPFWKEIAGRRARGTRA
jgi:hypothetical protein